ncbi:MAG: M14 family metallopeptidase [Lachnospiraceae bacterium]|nr:M14 family metallopeptidase [Lachnospiraceae bacterium]
MKTLTMHYGGLSAAPGKKIQGFVPLGPSSETIPATLINGNQEGKTVLISSGIHGSKYPGILTAMELAKELTPEDIHGQLILLHPVNTAAFYQRLDYINPIVGANLNRLYPGSPDGSLAEQVAWYMGEEYHKRVDFVIDLHGGDLHESLPPYVYAPGIGAPEVLEAAMKAALLVNANYLVKSSSTTGFYNSCAVSGTPAILIERGGNGLWSREEVESYKADIRNLLVHLGLLNGTVKQPEEKARVLTNVVYLDADVSGCWIPAVRLNEHVKQGQLLGVITDFFGNVLKEIRADFDSTIVCLASSLGVQEGNPLLTYGS